MTLFFIVVVVVLVAWSGTNFFCFFFKRDEGCCHTPSHTRARTLEAAHVYTYIHTLLLWIMIFKF